MDEREIIRKDGFLHVPQKGLLTINSLDPSPTPISGLSHLDIPGR